MGKRLRLWQPHYIYSTVERIADRQFAFKPNHLPDQPLLRWDSDPRALDPNNKLIPKPSIINIIGSSLVRAQQNNPVDILWADSNINHMQTGIRVNHIDDLDRISAFKRDANSMIARFTNQTIQRDGHLLTGPFRAEPCLDGPSAEQQLLYAVCNVVKDGLVDTVRQSPFLSTYRHFAYGDDLAFWWIEWSGYDLAGGTRNKRIHPKDFLKWGKLELTDLPEWEELTVHQRQTRFRQQVREIEEENRYIRREQGRTVVGVPALFATDPRDRPKNPKASSPEPLCHASNHEQRHAFKKSWREFVSEYRRASWDFRNGYWEREFPQGSFRPPIATIYNASCL